VRAVPRTFREGRSDASDLGDLSDAEQALVAANRELITRFEKKIQATLARVWGEESIEKTNFETGV
jgi:hypothetical protein